MFLEEQHWMDLTDAEKALMHSQRGPLASAVFTTMPTNQMTRIEAQPLRILLCRRLRLPWPLSSRTRAACSEAAVLGKRVFPLECAAAQVCQEAGARVTPNAIVRDGRRIEVIANGLTLWQELKWPSTPRWCLLSGGMGLQGGEPRGAPGWLWRKRGAGGVGGRGRTSPSGGVGCRKQVLVVCEGEGRVCATFDAEPSEGRVVEEVELHPGVQRQGPVSPRGTRCCGMTASPDQPHWQGS